MPNMSLKKNEMPVQDPNVRNKNFKEVALGYTEEQAVDEANRCLNCKNKPCQGGCPVSIDIPAFIAKIKDKDLRALIRSFTRAARFPLSAVVYVHRKHSARASAFAELRASR